MLKQRLLNTAFLAGTLSLLTVACQPSPTAPNTNRVNSTSGTQFGFSKKDWPANSSGTRPNEIQSLNVQLTYQGSTRNSSGHTVTFNTPSAGNWWDEPAYDIVLSDYVLNNSGEQYATKAYIVVRLGYFYWASGGTHNVIKSLGSTFTGHLESTDGITFRFVSSNGSIDGSFGEPDRDPHGNMNGSCQYYEYLNMPIKLDHNSTLTLNEAQKTFSLHIPFVNAVAHTTRGLSPWQCSFQCTSDGAYSEECDGQVSVNGSFEMGGKLVYTKPEQIQLLAEPEIFSTAPDVRGSTDLYFPNLAEDQLWRLTMPPLRGQPLVIEGFRNSTDYLTPWGELEGGWKGQKDWKTFSQGDISWEDYIFYQDGTYNFEVISDRHQRATATVRIDSTKPEFSEPDIKILQDGRRQITVTVKDPVVNGVRAGLDASMFTQMYLWTEGGAWGNVQAKQVDENTVNVVGEYTPLPKPTPTPQPTTYPSWSPSASSSPTYDASGNPNPGYSGNPTPNPTPTPWIDPDELLDDTSQIYFEFLAKDKVRNPRHFELELNPANLKIVLNERYFSPNDDGRKDYAVFQVNDESPSENWVLEIRSNGRVHKTITGYGNQNLVWDGKDNAGNLQPEGNYNLVLKSQDSTIKTISTKTVVLDLTAPSLNQANLRNPNTNASISFKITDQLSKPDWSTFKVFTSEFSIFSDGNSVPNPIIPISHLGTANIARIRDGSLKVTVDIDDHAANKLIADVNLGARITLDSVTLNQDNIIILQGKVLDLSGGIDLASLRADFFDDLTIQSQSVTYTDNDGNYTIEVVDYEIAQQLRDKIENSGLIVEKFPFQARVSPCFGTGGFTISSVSSSCLVSNIKPGELYPKNVEVNYENEISSLDPLEGLLVNPLNALSILSEQTDESDFAIQSTSNNRNLLEVGAGTQAKLITNISAAPPSPKGDNAIDPDDTVVVQGVIFLKKRMPNGTAGPTVYKKDFAIPPSFWRQNPRGPYVIEDFWYGRNELHPNKISSFSDKLGPYLVSEGRYYLETVFTLRAVSSPRRNKYFFNNKKNEPTKDIVVVPRKKSYSYFVPKDHVNPNDQIHIFERHLRDYLSSQQYSTWQNAATALNSKLIKAKTLLLKSRNASLSIKERNKALREAVVGFYLGVKTFKNNIYYSGKTPPTGTKPKGGTAVGVTEQEMIGYSWHMANLAQKNYAISKSTDPSTALIYGRAGNHGWAVRVRTSDYSIVTIYPVAGLMMQDDYLINYYMQNEANGIFISSYSDPQSLFNDIENRTTMVNIPSDFENMIENYRLANGLPSLARFVR